MAWLASSVVAQDLAPAEPRVVGLRYVHLRAEGRKDRLDTERIEGEVEYTNAIFRGAGVEFRLRPFESYDVPEELATDTRRVVAWSAIRGLASTLGLAEDAYPPDETARIRDWLARVQAGWRSTDVVAWVGRFEDAAWGGGGRIVLTTGYKKGLLAHELGHVFGLSHTFAIPKKAEWWDLLYYPGPDGNRYFEGRADFEAFMRGRAAGDLRRVDPRNEGGGSGRSVDRAAGLVTARHRSAEGCPTEVWSTGDAAIAAWTRRVGEGPDAPVGINAMTYWLQGDQENRLPRSAVHFLCRSQLERVRRRAAERLDGR